MRLIQMDQENSHRYWEQRFIQQNQSTVSIAESEKRISIEETRPYVIFSPDGEILDVHPDLDVLGSPSNLLKMKPTLEAVFDATTLTEVYAQLRMLKGRNMRTGWFPGVLCDSKGQPRPVDIRLIILNNPCGHARAIHADLVDRVAFLTEVSNDDMQQTVENNNPTGLSPHDVTDHKMEKYTQMMSGMVHNLKTPLAGIKGYAQLLKMDHGIPELDLIVQQVQAVEGIVNNMLIKNRRASSRNLESINLNELLAIELEFLKADMVYKHDIEKSVELENGLPSIQGQYSHFSQAILNLIQNAVDAMHQSHEKNLAIRTRFDDRFVYLDVEDTGVGIPKDIQARVFEPYFTTKPLHHEEYDGPTGCGLGLCSANALVHAYGGSITLESEEGKGTRATIRLPY